MVGVDGFEPTQPMVTDLQSAATLQLRRTPILNLVLEEGLEPSRCLSPTDFKSVASAVPPLEHIGVKGFEPLTSWSQTRRSTKLSYTPFKLCNFFKIF